MPVMTTEVFDREPATARRRAQDGPVIITDREGPKQVLLSYEEYRQLRKPRSLADALDDPQGGHIEIPLVIRETEPFRDLQLDNE